MRTELTAKESELNNVACAALKELGGKSPIQAIHRNPDPAVRENGKTEGTWEWAILQTVSFGSRNFDDAGCQNLIDILKGGRK